MRDWTRTSIVRRDPRVIWRVFDREVALIAPWSSSVRTANELGARCWELADGRTLGTILEALISEYEVDAATLERDVLSFLEELDHNELLARE